MKKPDWANKLALVTGASSGIGAATARKLAGEGLNVVMVARRADRLSHLEADIQDAGGTAYPLEADLSHEKDRQLVYNQIINEYGVPEVLVNNAGLGWYGYSTDMPWEIASEMLQVNVAAVVHLTLLFLKRMLTLNRGHIINVGSIAGSLPSQGVAVYSATKSFMDAFTTSLHRETAGTRLHLSVVRAGPVLTEFCTVAADRSGGQHLPTERIGVPAEAVAKAIWDLLLKPRRIAYVPSVLALTPWVEACFGWLMDRLGPLLLRRNALRHS